MGARREKIERGEPEPEGFGIVPVKRSFGFGGESRRDGIVEPPNAGYQSTRTVPSRIREVALLPCFYRWGRTSEPGVLRFGDALSGYGMG